MKVTDVITIIVVCVFVLLMPLLLTVKSAEYMETANMKYFTATFKGHWFEGKAVVKAKTENDARLMVEEKMTLTGLSDYGSIILTDITKAKAGLVQFDSGDY